MKLIQSRDNSQYRRIARLSQSARERNAEGMMLLDGDHLLLACRDAGIAISSVAIGESAYDNPQKRSVFSSIECGEKLVLADRLLSHISPVINASGLVGLAGIPVCGTWPDQIDTCLLLEGIQDPGNLGSMLRTAAAAGVRHIALSPKCASVWSPKVLRAGMGAHFRVAIHENQDLSILASRFHGVRVATDPLAERSLYSTELTDSVAWLFGSEGAGLSRELRSKADLSVSIPMNDAVESLNVASALAICLFEQLRQKATAAG